MKPAPAYKSFFQRLLNPTSLVLLAFILGSCIELVSRYKTTFTVTYDMGIQLNAAENYLVHGKLMTDHFAPQGPDLNIREASPLLTWFPPGFSYVFAQFRKLGLSSAEALKTYDVFVLGLGLLGWGSVLGLLLKARRPGWLLTLLLVPWAFCVPLMLSPWSGGTDSFLWATSALTLVFLHRLLMRDAWFVSPLVCAALIALSIAFRYASLYLLLPVAAALLLSMRHGFWKGIRAGLVFSAGFILCMLPLYFYNVAAQNGSAAPPYTYQNPFAPGVFGPRLYEVSVGLAKANCLWGIQVLDLFLGEASTSDKLKILSGALLLVMLVLGFCYLLWKAWRKKTEALPALSYLLVTAVLSLVLFLIIPSFGTGYNSITDGRYYMPLCPALQMAAISLVLGLGVWHWAPRILAGLLAAGFCAESLFIKQQSFVSFPLAYCASRASCEWQSVYSWYKNEGFGSLFKPGATKLALHHDSHEGREVLDRIRKEDPEALIFIQEQPYFHFDKADARLLGIPEQYFWNAARVSKDSTIYLFNTGKGKEIMSSLYKKPVTITNHLPIEIYAETPHWTIRRIKVPAGTTLVTPKP